MLEVRTTRVTMRCRVGAATLAAAHNPSQPWITPSVFTNTGNTSIVDEYTFGQMQDGDTALAALTQHWETWYTEDDFKNISAANLNHVRIPIGYWGIPLNRTVEPYISGAYPYFKTAVQWARKYGLYVIVDLHGAPGSQNGTWICPD